MPARLKWLWLTLGVVLLDRATKAWFETQTVEGYRRELLHHFAYFVQSRNPGLAFGLLSDTTPPWLRIALVVGSLFVIGVLAWLLVAGRSGGRVTHAGLALLLGGATGNLTDRVLHGAVTDFIEVWLGNYHWPAFNVADTAITVGAALVILELVFGAKESAPETTQNPAG
jgi:signal peptidase II